MGRPGGGFGNPFQFSCLENPMDRGAWQGLKKRHNLATKHQSGKISRKQQED